MTSNDAHLRVVALRDLAARAAAEHPTECWEACCLFAGRPVRVRVTGRTLADMVAMAYGHLQVAPVEPRLTIDLWDESITGSTSDADEDPTLGRTWLVGGGVLTSADQGRLVRHQLPHTTAWLDREAQAIVGSVVAAGELSLYERGKPLHYLLSLWHNDRGAFVTHGGMVGREGAGVLLAGVGGSGKSTTAAACLAEGFEYLGDDCIAVERLADGRFVGHSIFASPWLDEEALRRLPSLGAHAVTGTRPGEDKALVEVLRDGRHRLARSATVVAIALPRLAGRGNTRVRPASQGDAMRALGPSSILLFAPSPGATGLRHLARLVASVPSFWIDLGDTPAHAPAAVDDIIAIVGTGARRHDALCTGP